MKRAVIYARFSSHNQREESIDIQIEESRKYCIERGIAVVGEYADYARTGRNTERCEFQRLMKDATKREFDYVVIYKVTRIMRNRDEMSLARLTLKKHGVEILYAGEQISEGSSGVLQLGMLEVLAEWESAIDSERMKEQNELEREMENRKNKTRNTKGSCADYHLTGKLYCGNDVSPMVGKSATSATGRTYHYYECKKCHKRYSRDWVEDNVVRIVMNAIQDKDPQKKIVSLVIEAATEEQDDDISDVIMRELAAIHKQYDNMWKAIEQGITPPGGKERIDALKERECLLQDELDTLSRLHDAVITEDRIIYWLEKARENDKDKLLDIFVSFAAVRDDEIMVAFTFDDNDNLSISELIDEKVRLNVPWWCLGNLRRTMYAFRHHVVILERIA